MNAFIYRESSLARSVVGFLGSRRYLDLPLYVSWGCQGRNARLTLDANRTELFRRQENPACIVAPRNIILQNSTDIGKARVALSERLVKVITIRTGSLMSYVPPCGFL